MCEPAPGLKALAVALALAAAEPDTAFDRPVAPRWPGVVALLLGGTTLTVSTVYGAGTSLNAVLGCFSCLRSDTTNYLEQTTFMVGGGVLAMLAGMMYLAWVQPEEEPWPKSPGVVALTSGIVEAIGGTVRFFMAPGTQPFEGREQLASGFIILSGAVALAAGIVWLAWAGR